MLPGAWFVAVAMGYHWWPVVPTSASGWLSLPWWARVWHAGPWVSALLAVEVVASVHSETPDDSATPHPLMMASRRMLLASDKGGTTGEAPGVALTCSGAGGGTQTNSGANAFTTTILPSSASSWQHAVVRPEIPHGYHEMRQPCRENGVLYE